MLPLFSPFSITEHQELFFAVQKAGPEGAWRLMQELRHLDERARCEEYAEHRDFLCKKCLEAFALTPGVAPHQAPWEAKRFSLYPSEVQFSAAYIMLWLNDLEKLVQVVQVEGVEHLNEAKRFGKGVLLVPFHVGPATATVAVVAHHIPVTALLRKMPFDELKSMAFPDLDFDHRILEKVDVVRSALEVLRQGGCFSIFPEFDPRREAREQSHVDVPFFGAQVRAPIGPAGISKISRSPIVPVSGKSLGGGKFVIKCYPVIPPPAKTCDRETVTLQIWETLKHDLKERGIGDWEMWIEFERMVSRSVA